MNLRPSTLIALLLIFFLLGALIAFASEGGKVQMHPFNKPNVQTTLQPQGTPAPVNAEAAALGAPVSNWWDNLRRWLGLAPR